MKDRHNKDYFKNYYRRPEVSNRRFERKRNFLLFIANYKKDKYCIKCGWKENTSLLQFHHRDKKNKKRNIPNMAGCSMINIMEEIKKCDLLCLNCHYTIHYPQKITI